MEINNNGTALTNFLLKAAFAVIGASAMAYASYLRGIDADHETRIQVLERAVVGINTKLDLAINDIEFHHRSH